MKASHKAGPHVDTIYRLEMNLFEAADLMVLASYADLIASVVSERNLPVDIARAVEVLQEATKQGWAAE